MKLPKISGNPSVNWRNNAIQFPRLIEELQGLGIFCPDVIDELAIAMDLESEQVQELIDRAQKQWDGIKAKTLPREKIDRR